MLSVCWLLALQGHVGQRELKQRRSDQITSKHRWGEIQRDVQAGRMSSGRHVTRNQRSSGGLLPVTCPFYSLSASPTLHTCVTLAMLPLGPASVEECVSWWPPWAPSTWLLRRLGWKEWCHNSALLFQAVNFSRNIRIGITWLKGSFLTGSRYEQ